MKILKNKKSLSSVAAILVALALIAGSTMAWFVIGGEAGAGVVTTSNLDVNFVLNFDNTVTGVVPGQTIGNALCLYNGDGSLKTDAELAGITAAELDTLSYIENTGDIAAMIKLAEGGALVVTRYWEGTAVDDGTGTMVVPFPVTQTRAQMTWNAAGYPGVPGAVLAQMIIPMVPDNIAALDISSGYVTASFFTYDNPVTGETEWFLSLEPGAKIYFDLAIDLETNKDYKGVDGNYDEYLDNTYMDCDIDVVFNWVATQNNEQDSWLDVFGLADVTDLDYYFILDLVNACQLTMN